VSERAVTPAELELARALTLRYTVAATLILAASGLLGVVLRFSQADYGRIGDNAWYALMTAHGLGAFVGWAGFAVMGFAWWIFALVGFPLRPFGAAMARLTWWLMVIGVAGVIVTTLFFGFAGSWVFLYPLPFHSAGEWGDGTTAVFAASVLLVGLSIVTWCFGVLHTVVGPALHAVSDRIGTRLGVAMGFGYLWPRRFATNPTPVPYPVIPLTVIGIDMIIATLPLAGLLVAMIVQSFADVSVDPLLAKNVLWWFGHPVVYLLLFPAVAIFYYLVPRYAGRQLVAGGIIAVAWTIAVIANVVVWAHHMYLDYPEDTFQGAINVVMQPTTFALVLPSALSIYALGFTVFRSRYTWNAASTALFLALLSWALAGLSGIVNATIAFQEAVHNTLWVVGHFHHMAFANIGLVVIAATYAFLPELTGKPLYSERMALWHVWATFGLVTANSALWLWQGLEGAPRRFSVLPEAYEGLAKAAIPLVAVLAAAQLLFFWNVFQTVRGRGYATARERQVRRGDVALETIVMLLMFGLAATAAVAGFVVGRATAPEPAPAPPAVTSAAARGEEVFGEAGCGTCHTLSAAGAKGQVGPSLDATALSQLQIEQIVADGRGGMPSFADQLSQEEIGAVAAYVAQSR
jgi:cytochrome c oxidase subunit 1